ncbi:unannotated protein [freshwater metagenome]|uniref:Unannotated protein n=1 Tax=freshwater metagenome TaxID=449393 RepID=A0A6J6QGW4_9ZZZZ
MENSPASWKERIRPRRPRASGESRVTSWPSKTTRPSSGVVKPATSSKVVVLPAPLGPIRPRISPLRTSRSTPRTARTPPKDLRRPVTVRRGREPVTTGGGVSRSGRCPLPRLPFSLKPSSALKAASTSTPARLARWVASRSRTGTTRPPSPRGRYRMISSCPSELAARPALSRGRNVTPMTTKAPSSGPASRPSPPITVSTTALMLSEVEKAAEFRLLSEWPNIAPARPAMKPAIARPCSLTAVAGTVKARAASSLSRTATNRRPRPPLRTLRASSSATSSTATATK